MSGSGTLGKSGQGTLILSGTGNTLTGGTQIAVGTMTVNSGSSMGTGVLTMAQGGTAVTSTALNLNNTAQTVSSLTSSFVSTTGTVTQVITLGSGHTLTINQSGNTTYGAGSVSTLSSTLAGSGGIVKSGNGTLTLTSANSYSGATTVSGGTLELGVGNALSSSTNVTLNGGTLSTGSAAGFSQSVGTLNLNASSAISLGTGVHSLTFAASNGVTWNGTILTINGWTGTAGTSGTAGKLFVGSNANGLTSAQLLKINFTGYASGALILSNGEVVPSSALPVTLAYFNGRMTEGGALLGWQTAREVDNTGFRIERSHNAETFESIATVASQAEDGNSLSPLTYSYTDPLPLPGINYYRLVQTDRSGTQSRSKIIALSREAAQTVLYPNPVLGSGEVSLEPALAYSRYELVDVQGRVVEQSSGPGVLSRLSVASLPAGVYVLRLLPTGGGRALVYRLVR